jgi:L-fucose mutarotase
MLTNGLLHPQLLEALASIGHGSKVLIADGNYPFSTAKHPDARVVYLNVAPGLLNVGQVLSAVSTVVNFEAATLMAPPEGLEVPAHAEYRGELGDGVLFESLDRFEFYALARSSDVGLVIATGDLRVYANIILTIGVR